MEMEEEIGAEVLEDGEKVDCRVCVGKGDVMVAKGQGTRSGQREKGPNWGNPRVFIRTIRTEEPHSCLRVGTWTQSWTLSCKKILCARSQIHYPLFSYGR